MMAKKILEEEDSMEKRQKEAMDNMEKRQQGDINALKGGMNELKAMLAQLLKQGEEEGKESGDASTCSEDGEV